MNSWHMWRSFTQFVLKRAYAIWLVGGLLIALFVTSLLSGFNITTARDIWTDLVDPLIGFTTLLVALLVWWGEARQDWLASIPCKLTAIFLFNNLEVMRCELANLSAEADIRALGQQLGLQMNNNEPLRINAPAIRSLRGDPEENAQGEIYRHWTVEFPLLELPEVMAEAKADEMLIWEPPFDKAPHKKPRAS